MNELLTPIGKITVLFDGAPIPYSAIEVPKDRTCPDVIGRFRIDFPYESDCAEHSLFCIVNLASPTQTKIGAESGERLEALAFYLDGVKLTLGAEGEEPLYDGERPISPYGYDYDISYLSNGLTYNIFPKTKSQTFTFGVSWMIPRIEGDDCQTWYGADPSCM